MGKFEESLKMYESALEIKRVVYRDDSQKREILRTEENLANLYAELGRLSDAKEMLEKVLEFKMVKFGPEHEMTKGTQENLDSVLLLIKEAE